MAVQLLPDAAAVTVQLATGVLGVTTRLQVVATNAFPGAAPEEIHEATPIGPVLFTPQVVATQLLPDDAAATVHDAIGVGPESKGSGHVVDVNILPAFAEDAVHEATATLVVTFDGGQVVVV